MSCKARYISTDAHVYRCNSKMKKILTFCLLLTACQLPLRYWKRH
jgi:hypothetical protein